MLDKLWMRQKIEHFTQSLHNAVNPLLCPSGAQGDFVRRAERTWNPLSVDPEANRFSSYAAYNGASVIRPFATDLSVDRELIEAHEQLLQQILGQFYPCTGAVSAFSQHNYRFGLYPELACDCAVRAVCYGLYEFCHAFPVLGQSNVHKSSKSDQLFLL